MRYNQILLIAILVFTACKSKDVKTIDTKMVESDTLVAHKKKFDGVEFASKKDLSCGMPLTAGLEDSVHYKGKIYGFCSKECKNDFLAHAAAYTKQSK